MKEKAAIQVKKFLVGAQEILEFFQDHPLIWKSASQSVKDLFFVKGGQNGTRLFMLDYHMLQNSSGNVWHINSDLKALQGLNHQDLTPYLYYTSQILSDNIKYDGSTHNYIIYTFGFTISRNKGYMMRKKVQFWKT